MRESPKDLILVDQLSDDETIASTENIIHPEYDFSTVAAIELIRDNSKLFNNIPHIARTQLLTTFYSFFDQENNLEAGKRDPANSTLLKSGTAPDIFKSVFGHILHVSGFPAPTKTATTLRGLIALTTKLMRTGVHKPVEFFRSMIRFEHSNIVKNKEYGRHSIDSTGGVHSNSVDFSGYKGTAGEILHMGLAKGVLEILQNQAHLAGVAPFTKQEVANTRSSQRDAAREILAEIKQDGWNNLLNVGSTYLNDQPLLREPTVDKSKFTHDVTTKLSDPSLGPKQETRPKASILNILKLGKKTQLGSESTVPQPAPINPPEFSRLDLKEKKLNGIPVRIFSGDGKFFADTDAGKMLTFSPNEIEKIITNYSSYPMGWRPMEEMYSKEDENNWPAIVLSASRTQPNPDSDDNGIYRFRGALGRSPLHLHVSEYQTNLSRPQLGVVNRKEMYFWSGHWPMNGGEQNEIVKETKKLIKSKLKKNGNPRSKSPDFVIYPPLPSKDFGYQEQRVHARELSLAMRGLISGEPSVELTQARLESLGLTDLEIRSEFDNTSLSEGLKKINKYWNKPITDEVMSLMDPNDPPIEENKPSNPKYKSPLLIEMSKKIDEEMVGRIKDKYPNISPEKLELEKNKIRDNIRNYLSPQFNRTQLFSMIAGIDGSAGFCVAPNPQKQNGLGIGLAATIGEKVRTKLSNFMNNPHGFWGDEANTIGLNWSDKNEILSAFIATTLEQTYTRLGIPPLAVLDDMVAEYPDLAEAIALVVTPELREKTYLTSQFSELPVDKSLEPDPDSSEDYFTTAGSARRSTMALGIGLKGNHLSWRVRLSDPDFFEKIDYDRVNEDNLESVARQLADQNPIDGRGADTQASENILFANFALKLWNNREADQKGMIEYGMLAGRRTPKSNDAATNASKLDNYMKIMSSASERELRDLLPSLASAYPDEVLRKKLIDGFKTITVTALKLKQERFIKTASSFSSEVGKLAKHSNFADLVRLSDTDEETFHVRYPETSGMTRRNIIAKLNSSYLALETSGLLSLDSASVRPKITSFEWLVYGMAKLADSDKFINYRFKFDLARTIPSYEILKTSLIEEPTMSLDALMADDEAF